MSQSDSVSKNRNSPHLIIKDLYLQINNISQGVNIGLLVVVLATSNFYSSFARTYYSVPLFALTSLFISVIFWARYYFDTEILNRSFTVASVLWFFAYLVSQGVSISFITEPTRWLLSTGVFLLFGSGFYVLNFLEIRRKQKAGIVPKEYPFVNWQRRRMMELLVLSILAFTGAGLVHINSAIALPAAVISLAASIWQLVVTNDYRRCHFIETGL